MADLTGTSIKDNYKRLLQLTGTGQVELSASAGTGKYLTDGGGNASPLALSQSRAGLGTDSPADVLHIYSGSSTAGVRIDSQLPSVLLIDNNSPTGGAGTFKLQADGTDDSNVGAFIIEDLNASLVSQGKPFIIQTGADTNSLYIQADNKVGIGTSTPAKALDVAGDIGLSGNIIMSDDTSIGIADDAERIEFDGSGDISFLGCNVGIGTASPITPLHVDNSGGATLELTRTANHTSGTLGEVQFGVSAGGADPTMANILCEADGANDSAKISFGTQTTGGTNTARMTIKSTGNVGIGTSAPVGTAVAYAGGMLHIHQASGAGSQGSQIHLTNAATGAAAGNGGSISMWHDDDLYITNQESDGMIKFASGGNADALVIKDDGNIGIGTASPTADLHVESVDDEVVLFKATTTYSSGSSGPYIALEGKDSDGTNRELVRIKSTSTGANIGDLQFQTRSSTTPSTKMTILNNGNVGIGNTSPNISSNSAPDTILTIGAGGSTGDEGVIELVGNSHDAVSGAALGAIQFCDTSNVTDHINVAMIAGRTDTGHSTQSGGRIDFMTKGDESTTFKNAMTIDEDANVGIGTVTPSTKFDVSMRDAAANGIDKLAFFNSDNVGAASEANIYVGYELSANNAAVFGYRHIGNGSTSNYSYWMNYGEDADQGIVLADGGKVGIGVTDPDTALEVAGVIKSSRHYVYGSEVIIDDTGGSGGSSFDNTSTSITPNGGGLLKLRNSNGSTASISELVATNYEFGSVVVVQLDTGSTGSVIMKHNSGTGTNMMLDSDRTLTAANNSTLMLIYTSTSKWLELSFTDTSA